MLTVKKKRKAQSLVEYGLILALVSVVAIAVLQIMGTQIRQTVANINTKLQNANAYSGSSSALTN
ncbi:MAG: hypothetical protein A2287_03000 [Candidatus Melainabacteria bacterium RIFOXYA12_FULL_32_12]|nr:MAG: hypothetical protein A2255_06700 [Candidatus Melainabacteria bacterium RIFOXYA2_FULL_32_9]OGI29350.1 MAG: hypothetical protein A2287_03000 [Candidatus Melainabacteria bacterium RIFOXYA12_FULL_32_12]